MTERETIDALLACHRLALLGASRDAKSFSRMVLKEWVRHGYDIVPVNPQADEIEGRRCFHRLDEIEPTVEGVIVLTPRASALQSARDCVAAGLKRIWFAYTTATPEAVDHCRASGAAVVARRCPLMFLPQTPWFHRVHRSMLRLVGRHPK